MYQKFGDETRTELRGQIQFSMLILKNNKGPKSNIYVSILRPRKKKNKLNPKQKEKQRKQQKSMIQKMNT